MYPPALLSLSTPPISPRAQALLLCQLNTLAMDLPETPESLAAFSSLAAGEMRKSKKGKGKGKGKKRRREGGKTDESGTPIRPSDPLPDCRRARLVDYLQPISTMLDACTVTKPPPLLDDGATGGGGSKVGDKTKGFQSRAFDGTLADFLGLALVEHFASRLPRTLGALFEDFEYHPPDALTAALTGTPRSVSCASAGGANAAGNEAGGGPSKETGAVSAGVSVVAKEPFVAGRLPFSTFVRFVGCRTRWVGLVLLLVSIVLPWLTAISLYRTYSLIDDAFRPWLRRKGTKERPCGFKLEWVFDSWYSVVG